MIAPFGGLWDCADDLNFFFDFPASRLRLVMTRHSLILVILALRHSVAPCSVAPSSFFSPSVLRPSSGPTATAWHAAKYLDPAESGAVLPIVHVNGFKISERTIYGCMDDKEVVALFV